MIHKQTKIGLHQIILLCKTPGRWKDKVWTRREDLQNACVYILDTKTLCLQYKVSKLYRKTDNPLRNEQRTWADTSLGRCRRAHETCNIVSPQGRGLKPWYVTAHSSVVKTTQEHHWVQVRMRKSGHSPTAGGDTNLHGYFGKVWQFLLGHLSQRNGNVHSHKNYLYVQNGFICDHPKWRTTRTCSYRRLVNTVIPTWRTHAQQKGTNDQYTKWPGCTPEDDIKWKKPTSEVTNWLYLQNVLERMKP